MNISELHIGTKFFTVRCLRSHYTQFTKNKLYSARYSSVKRDWLTILKDDDGSKNGWGANNFAKPFKSICKNEYF